MLAAVRHQLWHAPCLAQHVRECYQLRPSSLSQYTLRPIGLYLFAEISKKFTFSNCNFGFQPIYCLQYAKQIIAVSITKTKQRYIYLFPHQNWRLQISVCWAQTSKLTIYCLKEQIKYQLWGVSIRTFISFLALSNLLLVIWRSDFENATLCLILSISVWRAFKDLVGNKEGQIKNLDFWRLRSSSGAIAKFGI